MDDASRAANRSWLLWCRFASCLREAKTQMPGSEDKFYAVCVSLTALPGMTVALKRNSGSWAFTTRIALHAQGIFVLDSEMGESWGCGRRLKVCAIDANAAVEYSLESKRLFLRAIHIPLMPA